MEVNKPWLDLDSVRVGLLDNVVNSDEVLPKADRLFACVTLSHYVTFTSRIHSPRTRLH